LSIFLCVRGLFSVLCLLRLNELADFQSWIAQWYMLLSQAEMWSCSLQLDAWIEHLYPCWIRGGTAIGPTFASLLLFLSSVWWSDENGTLLPINWNSWTSIPALPWFYSLLSAVLVIFEILLLQHKSCVHLWRASNRAHVHDTGGGPLLYSEKIKTKYSCIGLNWVDWLIRSNRNHLVDISVCLCLWPRFQLGSLACLQTEIMITVDLFWFLSIWPECIVLYILLSFSALCELATSLIFPRPVFVRTR